MKFANLITYVADEKKIQDVRPLHREYAQKLRAEGKIVIAGPFRDGAGALIIYEANSQDEAESLAINDPFFKCGAWASHEIHPWEIIGVNHELLRESA
jgi:uncharacterized protein YciI